MTCVRDLVDGCRQPASSRTGALAIPPRRRGRTSADECHEWDLRSEMASGGVPGEPKTPRKGMT